MVELVAKAAETGAAGTMTGTGLPPTLLVRVDVQTLAALHPDDRADPTKRPACSGPVPGRDRTPGPRPRAVPAAELDWGGPILQATLQRIGCTAQIIRIVTEGPSHVLDLGRARRLASPAQKLALAARDRGCIFPGCDRPPAWTDAHHLAPWAEGGATDLDGLALLCRFHHRLVHEGGWTLSRTAGGIDFIDPDGTLRGHHRL